MLNEELMPGWEFGYVQNDVKPYILYMLKGIFSLDTAHLKRKQFSMADSWMVQLLHLNFSILTKCFICIQKVSWIHTFYGSLLNQFLPYFKFIIGTSIYEAGLMHSVFY